MLFIYSFLWLLFLVAFLSAVSFAFGWLGLAGGLAFLVWLDGYGKT